MKRILIPTAWVSGFDIPALLIRLTAGICMMPHGYDKWMSFESTSADFMQFLGLSNSISLALCIFAELICSGLLALGIGTRLICIPLLTNAIVMVFVAHHGEIFGKGQLAFFYLIAYCIIVITGPGKYSLDNVLFKK